MCRKFAAVSRGIRQTNPQNLEKFAAENCGPYTQFHDEPHSNSPPTNNQYNELILTVSGHKCLRQVNYNYNYNVNFIADSTVMSRGA